MRVYIKGGYFSRLDQHHSDAFEQHHAFHEMRGAGVRAVETVDAVVVAGYQANKNQHQYAQHRDQRKNLIREVVQGPIANNWPAARRVEGLDICLEPHRRADEEAHHHAPVCHRHHWFTHQFRVEHCLFNQRDQAPDRAVDARNVPWIGLA